MADPSKVEFLDRLKGTSPVNDPQREEDSLVKALMDAASSAGQSYVDFTSNLVGLLAGRGRGAMGAGVKLADPIVRQIPPMAKQIPQDLSDAGRYLVEATYQHLERPRQRPVSLDIQREDPPPLSPEAERGRMVVGTEAAFSALGPAAVPASRAVKGAVKRGIQAARGAKRAAEVAAPVRAPAGALLAAGGMGAGTRVARSPAFKRWFGKSKVVDEKGEPMVVYHGTVGDFDEFDTGLGAHFGTADQADIRLKDLEIDARERAGEVGLWRARAQGLGGSSVMPVYLSINKPLVMPDVGVWEDAVNVANAMGRVLESDDLLDLADDIFADKRHYASGDWTGSPENLEWMEELVGIMRDRGYDGIKYRNAVEKLDWDDPEYSYIVFDPAQVKSATGNIGTYDPTEPSILRARTVGVSEGPMALHAALGETAPSRRIETPTTGRTTGIRLATRSDDTATTAMIAEATPEEIEAIRDVYSGPIQSPYRVEMSIPVIHPDEWGGDVTRAIGDAAAAGRFMKRVISGEGAVSLGPLVRGMQPDAANRALGGPRPFEHAAVFVASDARMSGKPGPDQFATVSLMPENPDRRVVMEAPGGRGVVVDSAAVTLSAETTDAAMAASASGREMILTHNHPSGVDPASGRPIVWEQPFLSFADIAVSINSGFRQTNVVVGGHTSWLRKRQPGPWITQKNTWLDHDELEMFAAYYGYRPTVPGIPKGVQVTSTLVGSPSGETDRVAHPLASEALDVLGFMHSMYTEQAQDYLLLEAVRRAPSLRSAIPASQARHNNLIELGIIDTMGEDGVHLLQKRDLMVQTRILGDLDELFGGVDSNFGDLREAPNMIHRKPKKGGRK